MLKTKISSQREKHDKNFENKSNAEFVGKECMFH